MLGLWLVCSAAHFAVTFTLKTTPLNIVPIVAFNLVPFNEVAPSPESQLEQDYLLEQTPLEWQRLRFWDFSRGRGLLPVLALLGLLSYALPWFSQSLPETRVLTGYQLARHHVGWLWGGAVGWFILIPLVVTRRSIGEMRGVRMIAAVFASLTALEVLVFVNITSSRQNQVVVQFAWEWGIWISCFVSALGTCIAATLGGHVPDAAKSAPESPTPIVVSEKKSRSKNRPTLH